jgi:NAD(P)-dependent dehydrogenase (short-subunit alcohol dehydrogenase family)
LVTGAGSGLGAATARAFAADGAKVACVDLNQANAELVSRSLIDAGGESLGLACDVGDAQSVAKAVDMVIERFGRLDTIVNAAAVDYTLSIEEMSIEQWDRVIDTNLRGPFLFTKAAFPIMKRQGSGHIVNVASTAAVRAWANASAYHASKWGLVGFGRGLGVEGREHGIRATTIIPGGMRTNFFEQLAERNIPLPDEANLQDPANVADLIVYAVRMPPETAIQEVIVTPLTETSWP